MQPAHPRESQKSALPPSRRAMLDTLPPELLSLILCTCSGLALARLSQAARWFGAAAEQAAEVAARALIETREGEHPPWTSGHATPGDGSVSILLRPTWVERLHRLQLHNITDVCLLYIVTDDYAAHTPDGLPHKEYRRWRRALAKLRVCKHSMERLSVPQKGGRYHANNIQSAECGFYKGEAAMFALTSGMPQPAKLWLFQCLGLHKLTPIDGCQTPTIDLGEDYGMAQPLAVGEWETLALRTKNGKRLYEGFYVDTWRLPSLAANEPVVCFRTTLVEASKTTFEMEEKNSVAAETVFERRCGPVGSVLGRIRLEYSNFDFGPAPTFYRAGPTIVRVDLLDQLTREATLTALLEAVMEWAFLHFPAPVRLQALYPCIAGHPNEEPNRAIFRSKGWRRTVHGDWSVLMHDKCSWLGDPDSEFEGNDSSDGEGNSD